MLGRQIQDHKLRGSPIQQLTGITHSEDQAVGSRLGQIPS